MSGDKSYDFISCQVDYWDSPWQNRHGFLWELAKYNRVFFLSPPFYLVDLLPGGRKKTNLHGFNMIKQNLYSYVPPRYLPYNYRFNRINRDIEKIRNNKIQKSLKALRFERPILLIWHPNYVDMIGQFNESLVIYYKYDHYAGYIGGDGGISPKEKKLFEKADMVLVTAQGLYDLHKNDCKEIHLVPNGVDFDFFSKAMTDEVQIPPDMIEIPQPRIGYIGVINEKVDFKLLTFLCKARPSWSIVLVGAVRVQLPEFKENLKELQQQKNCYFLGKKENKQVPSYIKGLNVCMMCYLVNEWTYYGYPLKMHEYLACGKPSVSSDLPEVRPYSDVVMIAHTYEQWLDILDQELSHANVGNINKRVIVANNNSWASRVNQVMTIINGIAEIKKGNSNQ
ncbi:MAG: glycosyltransferase family 1 protein [Deltaproteobacteria bacterium]|nr:glycosyltransferase family 1 protein [Deltaproteobacteria bacterium]